jgi:hypothetical protein
MDDPRQYGVGVLKIAGPLLLEFLRLSNGQRMLSPEYQIRQIRISGRNTLELVLEGPDMPAWHYGQPEIEMDLIVHEHRTTEVVGDQQRDVITYTTEWKRANGKIHHG